MLTFLLLVLLIAPLVALILVGMYGISGMGWAEVVVPFWGSAGGGVIAGTPGELTLCTCSRGANEETCQ